MIRFTRPGEFLRVHQIRVALRCHYNNRKGAGKKFEKNGFTSEKTRNIGIIAHIDAGKTTVTERLLYLSGMTKSVGDVDSGNTVTDFLDMERERGITIQSAAVTFEWKKHRINLIDTPGHVDFTVEVERCARVLDGVVTVLDGSAGVQAQTLTVWRQASKFDLPSTFFVNKMDKKGADLNKSLDSIEQKLGVKTILTSTPVYSPEGQLTSVIDLLKGSHLSMENSDASWNDFKTSPAERELELFLQKREEMFYAIAECDEEFMKYYLDELGGDSSVVEREKVENALRRTTLSRSGCAVSCGTALRSSSSVRPILDSVVDLLPSPNENNSGLEKLFGDEMSAIVFKIGHDKRKGQLSYIRVYTGELKNNTSVFNSNRGVSEGPVKLFIPYSDELQSSASVTAGNIAVVSGLENTITGDTLLATESLGVSASSRHHEMIHSAKDQSHDTHRKHAHDMMQHRVDVVPNIRGDKETVVLAGIESPDPVYFCCVEPPTAGSTHEFENALKELCREDPSLRVRNDMETGQTIVETMGELHLEVIKDRLVRGYGLNVFVGPLQVGYREVIASPITHSATVEDTMGEKNRTHSATITLHVQSREKSGKFKKILIDLPSDAYHLRSEWNKAINEGCSNALHNGPILGFPVSDIVITLKGLTVSGGRINPAILSACAHRCVEESLKKSGARLIEPIMKAEITFQDSAANQAVQPVLQELAKRRAQIDGVDGEAASGCVVVSARLPLAEMSGLSSVVRTLSSGLGSLHVQISDYQYVSDHDQSIIVNKMRGGADY